MMKNEGRKLERGGERQRLQEEEETEEKRRCWEMEGSKKEGGENK